MNYGRVKVVTQPAVEPVLLCEVLQQCRADGGVEDEWFERAIKAARRDAEKFQGRAYLQQVIEVTYDGFPPTPILLPRSPVISVDSLKYYDINNTEYSFTLSDLFIDINADPARISRNYGVTWPSTVLRESSSVIIRYTAGYGNEAANVPPEVKQAILSLVEYWYDKRELSKPPESFHNLLRPNRLHP